MRNHPFVYVLVFKQFLDLDRKRNIAIGTQQCTAQIRVLVNDLKNFDKERIRKIRSMIRVIIFEDLLKLF